MIIFHQQHLHVKTLSNKVVVVSLYTTRDKDPDLTHQGPNGGCRNRRTNLWTLVTIYFGCSHLDDLPSFHTELHRKLVHLTIFYFSNTLINVTLLILLLSHDQALGSVLQSLNVYSPLDWISKKSLKWIIHLCWVISLLYTFHLPSSYWEIST